MGIEQLVEDWPAVQKRWEAWWEQELHDRPLIAVTAPREGVPPRDIPEVDPETQWTDASFMVRRTLEIVRTTYYGGEALPVFWHSWSAGHALYLGCRPHFARDTVWVDPAPPGPDGYPTFEGWRESFWWHWMQESTAIAARGSEGRYFVMPMWGNHAGDNLGLARGTENLLIDIVGNPAWVKWAVQTVSDIQMEVFEVLWQLVSPDRVGVEGSVNYCSCWSPVRTMAFDCDLSCMMSPRQFCDLFLPPLVETMHTVDHRIYHLDGPGAIPHLNALLTLPELQAIQWVPGAGHEEIHQWLPLIKRIQRAGKGVWVSVKPEEVEPLLAAVRPEGLLINTRCATESEARALVERVGRR